MKLHGFTNDIVNTGIDWSNILNRIRHTAHGKIVDPALSGLEYLAGLLGVLDRILCYFSTYRDELPPHGIILNNADIVADVCRAWSKHGKL